LIDGSIDMPCVICCDQPVSLDTAAQTEADPIGAEPDHSSIEWKLKVVDEKYAQR